MGARRLGKLAVFYSARVLTCGGLSWKQFALDVWVRSRRDDLLDRAAQLSFYFLVAIFPLLIVLSAVIGYILSAQMTTYFTLLSYLDRVMPRSAFELFHETLNQITTGASGGKLSFGLVVSLWTASSGVAALIEGLNAAFEVSSSRSWWHRRLVAIALTLAIGALIAVAVMFLLAGNAVAETIVARLPVLSTFTRLSTTVHWLVGLLLLFATLILIYRFGPNVGKKRWEGVVPGACLAMLCWVLASLGFRFYLSFFGRLNHTYGSLGGVIALLFWLYLSAAAILLGGETNSIIWKAAAKREAETRARKGAQAKSKRIN